MSSVLELVATPEEWPTLPFGRLVERSKEAGRADLQPLSVFLDEGVVPRASREDNFNRLGADMAKYLVVRPGDIVFNKLRTWQGGLGVSKFEGIVSPAYFVCRPQTGAEPQFLHYLLRSAPYLAELTRVSKFMPPSQFDISWGDLCNVPVSVPTVATQQAIADFLDTETARIDALIEKNKRMAELLEERFETWIRHVFADLDCPVLPLKRRWRVIDCKHRTPAYVDDGYPVISPGDTTRGRLDLSRAHRFVDQDDFRDLADGSRRPKRGDIVYSRNASIGIASYIDTDTLFCMGQDVCLITSTNEDQLFLTYALNSIGADQLDVAKIGSTFSRVNISQILEVKVPVPHLSEQISIARRIDEASKGLDTAVAAIKNQIDLLIEKRQALITAAVTGDLEIPGVAA